jgi:hypothetical protein
MFDITRKFTVHPEGRGDIRVTPADYVTSGGEGHIYRPGAGSLALKIWDDPHRAISGRMVEKVRLLGALHAPEIVAPQALVKDDQGNITGYVMPWVTGWDLPLAFTNEWRAANGFGDADALGFAEKMRTTTQFVHTSDIIMGDANDLNIIGVKGEPRYIDVDPWLPPGFAGDKIMPTVHDWHSKPFSREADWFAWAVVTFQLLSGTHPYRGTHPDFKRGDLEGRMKANASVFDRQTRLSGAVRPFLLIPQPLLDWYRAAFQDGVRVTPPAIRAAATAPIAAPVALKSSGRLLVAKAFEIGADFIRMATPDVMLLADGSLISIPDGRTAGHGDPAASFVRLPSGVLFAATAGQGAVEFSLVGQLGSTSANIAASATWVAANRPFAVTPGGILELGAREVQNRYLLLPGRKWSLNANATTFGAGAAVYDAIGAKYLVVPQPDAAVAMIRVREIDGMKPIGIIGNRKVAVLSLIDRAGAYHRAVIVIADDLASCAVTMTPADNGSLSDIILDNGLVLWIDAGADLNMLAGGAISTFSLGTAGGRLIGAPSGVFYVVGREVYRLSMVAP